MTTITFKQKRKPQLMAVAFARARVKRVTSRADGSFDIVYLDGNGEQQIATTKTLERELLKLCSRRQAS